MPIPPRPIPTHQSQARHHRPSRPGASVPRKGALPSSLISESRAEMVLLSDPTIPRSVPIGLGAIRISATATASTSIPTTSSLGAAGRALGRAAGSSSTPPSARSEAPLADLIIAGKTKREKRATTASALGFDFVSNPTITPIAGGLGVATAPEPRAAAVGASGTPLANTPTTPALIPRADVDEGDEVEDEDDEWEHVHVDAEGECVTGEARDADDDDDIVVLGELELEDVDEVEGARGKGKEVKREVKPSYAAAAGQVVRV